MINKQNFLKKFHVVLETRTRFSTKTSKLARIKHSQPPSQTGIGVNIFGYQTFGLFQTPNTQKLSYLCLPFWEFSYLSLYLYLGFLKRQVFVLFFGIIGVVFGFVKSLIQSIMFFIWFTRLNIMFFEELWMPWLGKLVSNSSEYFSIYRRLK